MRESQSLQVFYVCGYLPEALGPHAAYASCLDQRLSELLALWQNQELGRHVQLQKGSPLWWVMPLRAVAPTSPEKHRIISADDGHKLGLPWYHHQYLLIE